MRYLLLLALLTGCATHWTKPGATRQDFQEELYACERDAAPMNDGVTRSAMVDRCLSVKGWRKAKRGAK